MEKQNRYNETLNLPGTEFPMRGNLPQREPEILDKWEKMNIYQVVNEATAGKPKFILQNRLTLVFFGMQGLFFIYRRK